MHKKIVLNLYIMPMDISPDKVVEQTIIARQKSLWDQYFLYMDERKTARIFTDEINGFYTGESTPAHIEFKSDQ